MLSPSDDIGLGLSRQDYGRSSDDCVEDGKLSELSTARAQVYEPITFGIGIYSTQRLLLYFGKFVNERIFAIISLLCPGVSTPYKRWSKCTMEKVGGKRVCRNLGGSALIINALPP